MKQMIASLSLLGLILALVGCAAHPSMSVSHDDWVNKMSKEHLMALASRFPAISLKESIPIDEVWTDCTHDLGGYLRTFQYVEPENRTDPFYRIYVNALVLLGSKSSGYIKSHVIVEQWAFDAVLNRFVIHYWGVMNPSEMTPYVEFRLIHKQEGRVLLDERQGFYSENHRQLVDKIRYMVKAILEKRSKQQKLEPGDDNCHLSTVS